MRYNNSLVYLLLQSGQESATGGKTPIETVKAVSEDILKQLPENFDVQAAQEKYPVKYSESMNTVLVQELIRFNRYQAKLQSSKLNYCVDCWM